MPQLGNIPNDVDTLFVETMESTEKLKVFKCGLTYSVSNICSLFEVLISYPIGSDQEMLRSSKIVNTWK